jgi:hypothetical protein
MGPAPTHPNRLTASTARHEARTTRARSVPCSTSTSTPTNAKAWWHAAHGQPARCLAGWWWLASAQAPFAASWLAAWAGSSSWGDVGGARWCPATVGRSRRWPPPSRCSTAQTIKRSNDQTANRQLQTAYKPSQDPSLQRTKQNAKCPQCTGAINQHQPHTSLVLRIFVAPARSRPSNNEQTLAR